MELSHHQLHKDARKLFVLFLFMATSLAGISRRVKKKSTEGGRLDCFSKKSPLKAGNRIGKTNKQVALSFPSLSCDKFIPPDDAV